MAHPAPRPPLFRKEALDAQARRLQGEILLGQPPSALLVGLLLGTLVLAGGVFLARADYARTERVKGYLTPSGGVSTILPPRPGGVAELAVQVGDSVHPGQILLRVSSGSTLAGGSTLEGQLEAQLQAQREELRGKLEAEQALFDRQQSWNRQQVTALRERLTQVRSLRDLAQQRWALAHARAGRFANMHAKGAVSFNQLDQERSTALGLQGEVRELELSLLDLQNQRGELDAAHEAAPHEHRDRQAELRVRLSELETRLSELHSRSGYAIVAPIAGRVAALQVSLGSTVTPGVPVALITPENAELEAALLVPTRAAGMLAVGQRVDVRFEAFPYQEFGTHTARILRVESAVLAPTDIEAPVPVTEPVYRISAALDSSQVSALGRSHDLQAGMLLEAEIILEQRSLLAALFETVLGLMRAHDARG